MTTIFERTFDGGRGVGRGSGEPDLANTLQEVADDFATLNSNRPATIAAANLAAQAASASSQTAAADVGAFTDPPSAGEMATLRTLVNESKADYNAAQLEIAELITLYGTTLTIVNELKAALNAVSSSTIKTIRG